MRRMSVFLLTFMCLGIFPQYANSASVKIEGLPIALGDSIETVKSALSTSIDPEPAANVFQRDTKALRLKTKGIWVFFDKSGQAYNIRLDAPFSGSIGGVKIGNSQALLVKKLGQPAKIIKMGMSAIPNRVEPHLYYIDDLTTVRFDFDRDGEIETIYILK